MTRGTRSGFLVSLAALTAAPFVGCAGSTRVTRARATAFEEAVNLRPSDVPEMRSFGGTNESGGEVVHFELTPKATCGATDHGERFDGYSPVFSLRGGYPQSLPAEGLHSRVSVMPTADEQERDFAAQLCELRRSEATRESTRPRSLPSPLPGVPVLAIRTRTAAPKYMFEQAKVTLYRDRFSFIVGPAEVVLAVSSAPRPPRPGLERRLLSLLYTRAEAHKL
jgi:hypothetical protein